MTESNRFADPKSGIVQENDDEITIDLSEVWNLARKNIGKMIGVIVSLGIAAALITLFMIPKTYESTVVLYLTPLVSLLRSEFFMNYVRVSENGLAQKRLFWNWDLVF